MNLNEGTNAFSLFILAFLFRSIKCNEMKQKQNKINKKNPFGTKSFAKKKKENKNK